MAEQSLLMKLGLADYNTRLKQWVKSEINDLAVSTPEGAEIEQWVETRIAELVNSAPETLDTLNELAAALGNDPNFATTVTTQLGQKATKAELNALKGGTLPENRNTILKIATELGGVAEDVTGIIDTELPNIQDKLGGKADKSDLSALATKAELEALQGGALPTNYNTILKIATDLTEVNNALGNISDDVIVVQETLDSKATRTELDALIGGTLPTAYNTILKIATATSTTATNVNSLESTMALKATKAELNALIGGTLSKPYDTITKIIATLGDVDNALNDLITYDIVDIKENKADKSELTALTTAEIDSMFA